MHSCLSLVIIYDDAMSTCFYTDNSIICVYCVPFDVICLYASRFPGLGSGGPGSAPSAAPPRPLGTFLPPAAPRKPPPPPPAFRSALDQDFITVSLRFDYVLFLVQLPSYHRYTHFILSDPI